MKLPTDFSLKHCRDHGGTKLLLETLGEQLVQVDLPFAKTKDDKFTLFWRGKIEHKLLASFANSLKTVGDTHLRILYFSKDQMIYLPPHKIMELPTGLENQLERYYGPPKFIRYEYYKDAELGYPVQHCRIAIWGAIANLESDRLDNTDCDEVGVYISHKDFQENRTISINNSGSHHNCIVDILNDIIKTTINSSRDLGYKQSLLYIREYLINNWLSFSEAAKIRSKQILST